MSLKIDFTTLKPRWKTVATSTSRTVTIPAGYRKYRINLMFTKPNDTWGCLSLAQKTDTAYIYIQGVQNGNWVQAERTTGSGDKAIIDLARVNTNSGRAAYSVSLYRETKTAPVFQGVYQATCEGSLTYVSGKTGFSISNGSSNMTFSTADAGSSYSWAVEAFDE